MSLKQGKWCTVNTGKDQYFILRDQYNLTNLSHALKRLFSHSYDYLIFTHLSFPPCRSQQVNGKHAGADEASNNWNFTLLVGLALIQV